VGERLYGQSTFSDFTIGTIVRGSMKGAIVQIVATNPKSSHYVALLYSNRDGRFGHELISDRLPFNGMLLRDCSAYGQGPWLSFAGTDWSLVGDAGVGRLDAVVLKRSKDAWRIVAFRKTEGSAGGDAMPGRGTPEFIAKLYDRKGKLLQDISTIPCFETDERWVLRNGKLVTVSHEPKRNLYWAADGLAVALRNGDLTAARRFVSSDDVLKGVEAADFASGTGLLQSAEEGRPDGKLGLQIDGTRSDGKSFAYGVTFQETNGRSVVTEIKKYM
jgi:hypothetical protein